jgi:protein-disulfide isomerase
MKVGRVTMAVVAAALVGAFLLAAVWYRRQQAREAAGAVAANQARLVRDYSPTLGPPDAPVTVVEFLDPECEACRAMHPIVKRVLEEHDGRVRLVVRYMPFHQNSALAASLLEASRAHGKYWEVLDTFFLRQPEWASHHAPRPELLYGYAVLVGLDETQWKAEAGDPEWQRRLRQDAEDGAALGVTRTPTLFVNGRRLEQLGYQPLGAAVEAALPR